MTLQNNMARVKRALVTGSSRGIGRAIAIALAKDGYEVIVHCAGNVAKADKTKTMIEEQGGVASVLVADLCNTDSVKQLAEEMGDIDILVLNASLQIRRPWIEIPLEAENIAGKHLREALGYRTIEHGYRRHDR